MATATIQYDGGGCHVEWYDDDDGDSGYGDGARIARWYGTRRECESMLESGRLPSESWWVRAGHNDRPGHESLAHSCVGGDRY